MAMKYMNPDGEIIGNKLVGHVEYDSELGECVVYVDGKPYTWEDLGKNISTFEGWQVKIEFVDAGDELD